MIQVGTDNDITTTAGAAVKTLSLNDSNGNTGINIGVSEDLGNGVTAIGNIGIQTGIAGSTSSSTPTNGVSQTFVGLTGDFGTIKAGSLHQVHFLTIAAGDAGGGYLVGNAVANNSQHQSGTVGGTALIQANSFSYTLPTFVEGLSLKYVGILGESSTSLYGTKSYAADYAAGALTAGVAYSTYKYSATYNDLSTSYYATYNFGPATIKALFNTAATGGLATVNSSSLGVNVPMGAMTFMYNYSMSDGLVYSTASGGARTVSATDVTANFIGAKYAFSKRTTGYVANYNQTGYNGAYSSATNSKSNTTRFILMHAF
jgi:predicted porin